MHGRTSNSASDPTAEAKALGCGLPHSALLMANRSRAAGNAARDTIFHSVARDRARDFPMGFTYEITFDPIYFLNALLIQNKAKKAV